MLLSLAIRENCNLVFLGIGFYGKVLNVIFNHGFKPDALPDTALRGVPDFARIGALLTTCATRHFCCICTFNSDFVYALCEIAFNCKAEGCIATTVLPYLFSVYKQGAMLVNCTKMNIRYMVFVAFGIFKLSFIHRFFILFKLKILNSAI